MNETTKIVLIFMLYSIGLFSFALALTFGLIIQPMLGGEVSSQLRVLWFTVTEVAFITSCVTAISFLSALVLIKRLR